MDWNQFDAALAKCGAYTVYADSRAAAGQTLCAMVRSATDKKLAVAGETTGFSGERCGEVLLCPLSVENARVMMELFPYTKPCSHKNRRFTLGLGDRLGLATPGQLRAIAGYDVFPVLAQQSIRELNLTGRTFPEVIAAAAFGVFQAGYRDGYGADGDHLKTKDEIHYALESGCTMITLDCSAHINDQAAEYGPQERQQAYTALPADLRQKYESKYLNRALPIVGELDEAELQRIVLVFSKAIDHAIDCWNYIAQTAHHEVDFELSIDEARAVTAPAEHLVIAMELKDAGITPVSVAPHFTGEFEKGIEYQGNLDQFAADLTVHQQIADAFGYKLSLHSGSENSACSRRCTASPRDMSMSKPPAPTGWRPFASWPKKIRPCSARLSSMLLPTAVKPPNTTMSQQILPRFTTSIFSVMSICRSCSTCPHPVS